MALTLVMSWQTYIGIMDRVEHAHHQVHFPNPLAGDVEYCIGAFAGCDESPTGSHDPLMHHHGDAAIMFIAAPVFVLPGCSLSPSRCDTQPEALVGIEPLVPDHPPKTSLGIRV